MRIEKSKAITKREWKKVVNYSWEGVASVGDEKASLPNSSISNCHALNEPAWYCTHLITPTNNSLSLKLDFPPHKFVFFPCSLWQFSSHNNPFSGNSHSLHHSITDSQLKLQREREKLEIFYEFFQAKKICSDFILSCQRGKRRKERQPGPR